MNAKLARHALYESTSCTHKPGMLISIGQREKIAANKPLPHGRTCKSIEHDTDHNRQRSSNPHSQPIAHK